MIFQFFHAFKIWLVIISLIFCGSIAKAQRVSVDEFLSLLQQQQMSSPKHDVALLEIQDRQKLITGICKYINQNDKQHKLIINVCMTNAIELLGQLRATEAIPTLIDHLSFISALHAIAKPIGHNDKFYDFPALDALVHIGIPAFDPLIEKVAIDTDTTDINNIAQIFVRSLGLDESLAFLAAKESDIKTIQQKDSIEKLIKIIKSKKIETEKNEE